MANSAADKPTDEDLLRGHLGGDPACFGILAERYTPELFRFLMRFLGRRAMAEDVIQETFLQVHLSAATFDLSRRVKPWLFTIAANKARDALRSRNRRREISADQAIGEDRESGAGVVDLTAGSEEWPGEAQAEREEAQRVRAVVAELPEHLREVLVLGYFHQFAYREIAEILDVPIGTVKSRLHTAVAQFGAAYRRVVSAGAGETMVKETDVRGSRTS